MSAPMKKHPIKIKNNHEFIRMAHGNKLYQFPIKIAEKYCIKNETVDAEDIFANINNKYTKPGALFRGIRIRENLTQVEMAKLLKVTQSDVSQMENGARNIGRVMAKRIEKMFKVDYKVFLE
jgi:DNA-binding XRE family transcriptional regulator